jgi:hypothetical protein
LPSWVCWKLAERDGKPTKIPVDPKTGKLADSSDPKTWADFETTVGYFEAHKGNSIAGVGFEFGGSDCFGVDLDHCRDAETGQIEPWAQDIVSEIASYTELSPSRTGLHIIGRGSLPEGARRKGKIEMYDSGRYFTVTGMRLEGTPREINERNAQIRAIHGRLFQKEQPTGANSQTDPKPVDLEDSELLLKMSQAANGSEIRKLYDGHWQECGFPSQSEADMALCCHLAFWTGKDAERIDTLFRQSALYREKWNRKHHGNGNTYGQETIRRATEQTGETYTPPRQKSAGEEMSDKSHPGTEMNRAEAGKGVSSLPRPDKNAPIDPLKYLKTGAELQLLEVTVTWLVEDLIPEASITTVIGPAGYGKSTVCLNLANAVDRGLAWMGRQTMQKPVYVLDFENPLAVDVERARSLDLSGVFFWHTSAEVPPPRIDSAEYEAYKKLPPGLVIVDGHRASQRGDENSSQDTGLVMERWKELRDLGFTIILIHHTQKANAEVFRGSQALIDQADHCLYFYPVRQPGSDAPIDMEDPDSMTYFLGTKDKTRYKACKLYLKRAGAGRFVPAENPDDERMTAIKDLLSGRGSLLQKDLLRLIKDELGYSKGLALRLLKKGEKTFWEVTKGEKNSKSYQFSNFPPL